MSLGGVGILYLSDRRVAYSSLAFHLLRGYLRENGYRVHSYFLEEGEVRGEGVQPHPSRLQLILVSLPYEIMYLDLVKALDYLDIPIYRRERGRDHPLIVVGGPAVTANPTPLFDIVDAILVGEAEPVLDTIGQASEEDSKGEALQALADQEGILVPGINERTRRVYVKRLDDAWYPVEQPIPPGVEPVWGRSFMLETTRGCARMCRFCMEGSIFLPKRDRSLGRLVELLEEGISLNKTNRVSFYSLAFFDSPHAQPLLEYAVEELGLEVSVPSIRAETLTPERAEIIAKGGQKTITIAPETGSCRIGKAINKCIGKEGAIEAVRNAVEGGIRNVKLYVITGFPGEKEDDILETIEMIREASMIVSKAHGRLRVSINPFMPKPVTALQWAPLEDPRELRRKIRRIEKEASKAGARVSTYDPKWAVAQTLLARGGPELSRLIVEWARRGGGLGAMRSAARSVGVDISRYTGPLDTSSILPWHSVVEHPYLKPERLLVEYKAYIAHVEGKLRIGL